MTIRFIRQWFRHYSCVDTAAMVCPRLFRSSKRRIDGEDEDDEYGAVELAATESFDWESMRRNSVALSALRAESSGVSGDGGEKQGSERSAVAFAHRRGISIAAHLMDMPKERVFVNPLFATQEEEEGKEQEEENGEHRSERQ